MFSAEAVLLPLQQLQQHHDELAHRDILSFDLYKRLKHMVLHFYKYAGKVEGARLAADRVALRHTLLDTFIICMASANALNISIGAAMRCQAEGKDIDSLARELGREFVNADLFSESVRFLVVLGGQMAKAIESADHMEDGNPRAAMKSLVPQLAEAVLSILGNLPGGLEQDIRTRFLSIENRLVVRPSALGR